MMVRISIANSTKILQVSFTIVDCSHQKAYGSWAGYQEAEGMSI